MGAFFTNVQVAIGQRRPADVRDAIVGTLRASVSGAGLVEDAALADEDAARVIYVGPSDADGWISVYDDATEDQDEDRLRALAEALSRAGDAAVNILCHDSDILDMHLCRDGAEVDHYNNFPNYFDDGADERAPAEGDAALWQPVLVPGTTPETLRAAWEVEDVFAEDTLARIAPLFGWDMDRCSVGVRYLPEAEQDLGGYARLVFREAQAQGDASRGQASLVMSGPPRLIPTGGQQAITFAVGAPLAAAVASFRNTGGPASGVRVVLRGPALDDGLVEPRTARLICHRRGQSRPPDLQEVSLEAGQAPDGLPLRHAEAPDFGLPAGLDPQSPLAASATMRQVNDLHLASWVSVQVALEVVAPGEGQLHLGLTPLGHPEGQVSWTFTLAVSGG